MKVHMTKELLIKQKDHLKNIEEIQHHHNEILFNHLHPPTLEKNTEDTPPKTALPTPNYIYQEKIKNTVLNKKHNIDIKEE
jgi:hypothetical protein